MSLACELYVSLTWVLLENWKMSFVTVDFYGPCSERHGAKMK